MKINRINADSVYNISIKETAVPTDKKIAKETKASSDMPQLTDKVQFSDKAKVYSAGKSLAKEIVKQVSEPTASEKLLKLKNEVSDGSYNVPSDKIASAIFGNLK